MVKRSMAGIVAVACACAVVQVRVGFADASINAAPAEIWVSPAGDDTNAGTHEAPVKTIQEAQRKARSLRRLHDPLAAAGIRIVLHSGDYPLNVPLQFFPGDDGSATSPTTVEAAPGEHPLLDGGVPLQNWHQPAAIDIPSGLPDATAGHVWTCDPPLFNGRVLEFRQLWIGDKKATRARTPNGGTFERLQSWDREHQEAGIPATLGKLLTDPAGVEMVIQQQWAIGIVRVKDVRIEGDRAKVTFQQPESKIEFEHPWPQPILPPKGSGAFHLVNSIRFLDEPGEWFQSMPTGRVYYWPREGEDLKQDTVTAPALQTLLQVEGTLDRPVASLTFRGIAFEHSTWMQPSLTGHIPLQAGMRMVDSYQIKPKGTDDAKGLDNQNWVERMPAAVTVANANNVQFLDCTFSHTAASGLDFVTGTHDDTIQGCKFLDIGGNPLQMGSFQERAMESHVPYHPTDLRVVCQKEHIANNLIVDGANEDWGCVAMAIGYARDVTIEHNDIRWVSYSGISLGWGWTPKDNVLQNNRVHANLIEHVATRMCDTAGIYTLSKQPGTIIDENVVDAVKMSPYVDRPNHWFYLYADEGSQNMIFRDNWIPDAKKILKNANGPEGNTWTNNGPTVSDTIKNAAGLEPQYAHLRKEVAE